MGNNNYYDGTNYKYINTDFAGQIQIGGGNILLRVAPSGTAGNNVTFTTALTIASTGAATFSSNITMGGNTLISTGATGFTLKTTTTGAWAALYGDTGGLYLGTNAGNWMFINNSGNVGIGTSSPQTFLHVLGSNTSGRGQLCIQSNNASNAAKATWYYDTTQQGEIGTTGGDFYALAVNNFPFYAGGSERMRITIDGYVGIGTSSPTEHLHINNPIGVAAFIRLQGTGGGGVYLGKRSDNMELWAGNAERMRITSGGSVGIGNSNPFGLASSLLAISGNGSTYNLVNIQDTVNANNVAFLQFLNSSAGGCGSVTRVGTTNAVLYNTTSDYRLKEDLQEIKGLDKVCAIKVYDFKWKDNECRMDGVIAHELQEILPYAVHGEKDGINEDGSIKTQGVDYSKIVPILVKAIQELKAEIEELKQLIAAK